MLSKAFRPHQRGELVTALLTSHELESYVDTTFTARLEAQLDAISAGEHDHQGFLGDFWGQFQPAVAAVADRDTLELRDEVAEKCAASLFPAPAPGAATAAKPALVPADGEKAARPDRTCPSCGVGQMSLKFSRYGPFVGCSEYPSCGFTMRPRDPGATDVEGFSDGKASIGVVSSDDVALEPSLAGKVGLEVSVRDGPIGWYVQLGGNVTHELQQLTPPPDVKAMKVAQLREELGKRGLDASGRKADLAGRLLEAADLRPLVPHKRVSIPDGVKPVDVTMDMARRLLSLPALLGQHPTHGANITLHLGRFGSYVRMDMAAEPDAARDATGTSVEEVTVMASLPKKVSMWDVDVAKAAELLDLKVQREANRKKPAKRKGKATSSASTKKPKKTSATRKTGTPKAKKTTAKEVVPA